MQSMKAVRIWDLHDYMGCTCAWYMQGYSICILTLASLLVGSQCTVLAPRYLK